MIGFDHLKFGLDTPHNLRSGTLLKDTRGFAVDVS